MGRGKLQGTPWHYEHIYEIDNNIRKNAKPYEYPYKHKTCYFEHYNMCKNQNSKHFDKICKGFELCPDFSLTERSPKTYKKK